MLSVLLVNARYLLIGAALRPLVAEASLSRRLGLAYLLTDESFAMAIGRFRRGYRGVTYYATIGVGLWLAWNASTFAGALYGSEIPEIHRWGIDFAITASFLAVAALGIRDRSDAAVAIGAAVLAAALRLAGGPAFVVVAAGALARLGFLVRRRP